ncbi:U3 small nucleolar ribonucleoprotein protein LCP5 [Marchantia polymorpha subsp. ruderalis]|uniref:Sas10 C-terminal domain-containing protein n=2 Tax=Marchantia polymorpha TaxID=3197 RepID=A0AAF6BB54_MARPO|nr:hypothetical protein MARPO_0041s0093 [Marchantia polymorpha]BBN09238.1 hypothetical protein Mp_4g18120 [Marchantia polymorpha subsp. ruderalis]|eukprot:PTQ40226.1 hypothetical protein MARPO_0041s0093 [Marchantia polymorpha]
MRRPGGLKKGRKKFDVDEDLVEGLGRAHDEEFLKLDDASESDSDGEKDNPVFNLQESESEEEENDDEDEDDMSDEDLTGLEAKLVKTAKFMKRKVGIEEDDEEDEEENEKEEGKAWGKSKKLYYSADNVDYELQSSDEEAPAEEEAEVLRLQRKAAAALRPEDYEQDDEDDESSGGEETLQQAVQRKEKKSDRGKKSSTSVGSDRFGMDVEKVKKDLDALTSEEKMNVVMSDAPELVGLLNELREGLDELRNKVQPLVHKVKDGQYATKDGISYLEVKNLLLLSYCQCIIFYLMLKAEGRSVRDHPVITRLVELRLYLEKIRPIDKKLHYQIDKLLKAAKAPAAADAGEQTEDALKFKPNPNLLVSKMDEDMQEGGGVYRPPMIAPAAMEGEEPSKDKKAKARADKESRRKASRSAFIKELADELDGKPEEMQDMLGTESKEMMREKERLEARAKEEEELFARVPLTKVERKKLKKLKQSRNGLMDLLDDFDDNLADLVGMDEETRTSSFPEDLIKPRKLSQVIAESGRPAKKPKVLSGDADLPVREELGERRRKYEMTKPSKFDDSDDGNDDQPDNFEPEEDDFYKEVKMAKEAKKAAKLAMFSRESVAPAAEEEADGKRHITNMMEKNRGLTPHRKKLTKNPRKKYKLKHEKAVIRRKGQVRDVKTSGGSYGGEATGIRTGISRSIRIQN